MNIFTNRRNIRVNRANLMRLISRGIIDRRNVNKSGSHIMFSSVPFAYARRITSTCDLEVFNNDKWNFVRNMDYDTLEKFYKDEIKKEPKKDGIVIIHDEIKLDSKIEIQQVKEDPVENNIEEVKNEATNNISEEIKSEIQEDIPSIEKEEDIHNDSTEEIIEENNIDTIGENSVESIPEEPIMEASEEVNEIKKEIEEETISNTEEIQLESQNQNGYRDLNKYNFNKPSFKKRKRK